MGSVREGFDVHEWKYRGRVIVEEAGGCTKNSAAVKYYGLGNCATVKWEAAADDVTHYKNPGAAFLKFLGRFHPSIRPAVTTNSICSAARSRLARFNS